MVKLTEKFTLKSDYKFEVEGLDAVKCEHFHKHIPLPSQVPVLTLQWYHYY